MEVPTFLIRRGVGIAVTLICVGLSFMFIYFVCFCLYAGVDVGVSCFGSGSSIGECVTDMIRAPFYLALGPLSSFDGELSPSPYPQVLLMALTVSIALTAIAYLINRRWERKT